MWLDAGHKKAIARVEVSLGDDLLRRGTGFLVAPGKVLTAAHVILGRAGEPRGDSIWLAFGTTVDWPAGARTVVEATIDIDPATGAERCDVNGDWALLTCASPEGATPLDLDLLRDGYDPHWRSFGYSEATERGKGEGQPYGGAIDDVDKRSYTLHVTQAAAGGGSNLSGLSGAPCMVHGRVVGMIRSAELTGDASGPVTIEGRAYATPIGVIAAACPDAVRLLEEVDVPYHDQLRDAVYGRGDGQAGTTRAIARYLEIDRHDQAELKDLCRSIVCQLFRRGLATTVDVAILHIDALEKNADTMVDLAMTFWVPDRAVKQLSALVERPHKARAAALNTASDEIAKQYLRRAGTLRNYSKDGWRLNTISVDNVSGELLQLAAIERAIRAHFDDASDKEIKRALRDHGPYLLLLLESAPRADVLDAIEAKFEGIYVVLLTGQAWTPDQGRVHFILPELGPGEEERVLDGCTSQRKRFEKRKKQT